MSERAQAWNAATFLPAAEAIAQLRETAARLDLVGARYAVMVGNGRPFEECYREALREGLN